jgi:hypothetical protein
MKNVRTMDVIIVGASLSVAGRRKAGWLTRYETIALERFGLPREAPAVSFAVRPPVPDREFRPLLRKAA